MQWVVLGFVGIIFLLVIVLEVYNRIKLKMLVKNKWGKLPNHYFFDKEESLKKAWTKAKKYRTYDSEIDDMTWYDLNGFALFEQINGTYSSAGSEALYQRLRNFNFSPEKNERLETLIDYYIAEPKSREKIQFYFACLGKKDNNHVESYLTEAREQRLPLMSFFLFCGVLPLIELIWLSITMTNLALICLVFSLLFNIIYYQVKKEKLYQELACMAYLVQTIACAKKIIKIKTPFQAELRRNLQPLASITRFAISFRMRSNSEAELLFEYVSMVVMLPFISYNFVLNKLTRYEEQAKKLWQLLGELEVAAAVLNFRTAMPVTSQPVFSEEIQVRGEEVYHPLLSAPVSNDVVWTGSTIVTGSNASGKSTYVKSIAISCILSATIHTALATKFQLPYGHVLTAMAVEDDIFEGDSYFVTEIKAIKRVLDLAETGVPCLCFIDEILKGTNTIERIAASTSIIQWLNHYDVLAFVATHDIELPEILKDSCKNIHFEEQVTTEQGITFDYLVRQGVATTRNAIKLLNVLNYPQAIVTSAEQEAAYFDEHRIWQVLKREPFETKN